jgi:Xaa-Pro aminopeptidase
MDIFNIVKRSRDVAVDFLKDKWTKGEEVKGWEVDKACRDFIVKAGFGENFTHRTGHSLGTEVLAGGKGAAIPGCASILRVTIQGPGAVRCPTQLRMPLS